MNQGTNERSISSLSYQFPKPSFLLAEHHWATSLLNRLFTEQPLPWDTSSLSCLLSGLLLWPASALSSLSYFSGLTSATHFFLWTSLNPILPLAQPLQSAFSWESCSITNTFRPAAVPMRFATSSGNPARHGCSNKSTPFRTWNRRRRNPALVQAREILTF